jgi:hypothetical protein
MKLGLIPAMVQIKDDEESLAKAKEIIEKYPDNQVKIIPAGTKIDGIDEPTKGTQLISYYVHPNLYPLEKKWPDPSKGPESLDPMWDELEKMDIIEQLKL